MELHGKNLGGIYEKLGQWLHDKWRVTLMTKSLVEVAKDGEDCFCCGYSSRMQMGDIAEHYRLCDKIWTFGEMDRDGEPRGNGVYKSRGSEGENNMGKLTMDLVDFMTHECGWTFHVCDSANLGYRGDVREQQITLKAPPHPLNLIAPLVMIELRQIGYVEINGPDTDGLYEKLGAFLKGKWSCSKIEHDPEYCAQKYKTSAFKGRGSEGENNMGQRTMELVDFMVKEMKWTMVTCNGGNFGPRGDKREQQLVFRNDEFVQNGEEHIMVELRTKGYIEVNGTHDGGDIGQLLDDYVKQQWGGKDYTPHLWQGSEMYCDKKYTMPNDFYFLEGLTSNLGKRTLELANFLGQQGWALLLCNGGTLTLQPDSHPNRVIRETQVKFTRAKTQEKAEAPLLMVEFRTVPYQFGPCRWRGHIEICGENTNGVYEALDEFIREQIGGQLESEAPPHCDRAYVCTKRSRTNESGRMDGESNIGQVDDGRMDGLRCDGYTNRWTMRLCDFMVDHLGQWDLIVCNSDNMAKSFHVAGSGPEATTICVRAREMQMVFRHKPGGPEAPAQMAMEGEANPSLIPHEVN